MSLRDAVSLSLMSVLWMRNLSLHLVLSGGSSLIACNITVADAENRDAGEVRRWMTHLGLQPSLPARLAQNWAVRSTAEDVVSATTNGGNQSVYVPLEQWS